MSNRWQSSQSTSKNEILMTIMMMMMMIVSKNMRQNNFTVSFPLPVSFEFVQNDCWNWTFFYDRKRETKNSHPTHPSMQMIVESWIEWLLSHWFRSEILLITIIGWWWRASNHNGHHSRNDNLEMKKKRKNKTLGISSMVIVITIKIFIKDYYKYRHSKWFIERGRANKSDKCITIEA